MTKSAQFRRLLSDQMEKLERSMAELSCFVRGPSLESGRRFEAARAKAVLSCNEFVRFLDNDQNFLRKERQTLFRLTRTLERMLDLAHSAIQEMLTLRIEADVFLREMSVAGYESSRYMRKAWQLAFSQPRRSSAHVAAAKRWARQAGEASRQAVASVLKNSNAPEEMKTRALYRYYSEIAECCDLAADLVCDLHLALLN